MKFNSLTKYRFMLVLILVPCLVMGSFHGMRGAWQEWRKLWLKDDPQTPT